MFLIVTILFRYEMRFKLKTGLASQKRLSVSTVELPRVNESYTGRYSTFVMGDFLLFIVNRSIQDCKMLIMAADERS